MDKKIVMLYTTVGCHLCVLARQMLEMQLLNKEIEIVEIDIVTDETLLHRYGERIPVIQFLKEEICYPFTDADIAKLLSKV